MAIKDVSKTSGAAGLERAEEGRDAQALTDEPNMDAAKERAMQGLLPSRGKGSGKGSARPLESTPPVRNPMLSGDDSKGPGGTGIAVAEDANGDQRLGLSDIAQEPQTREGLGALQNRLGLSDIAQEPQTREGLGALQKRLEATPGSALSKKQMAQLATGALPTNSPAERRAATLLAAYPEAFKELAGSNNQVSAKEIAAALQKYSTEKP